VSHFQALNKDPRERPESPKYLARGQATPAQDECSGLWLSDRHDLAGLDHYGDVPLQSPGGLTAEQDAALEGLLEQPGDVHSSLVAQGAGLQSMAGVMGHPLGAGLEQREQLVPGALKARSTARSLKGVVVRPSTRRPKVAWS